MEQKKVVMDAEGINRSLTRIAPEIREKNKGAKGLAVVGIQRGGVHLAKRLAAKIHEIE